MIQLLSLFCYGLVLLFGIAVSVCFQAPQKSGRIFFPPAAFSLALFLQIVCWQFFGLEQTKELYPLIVHLPLVIFLHTILKRSWLVSLSSVFAAIYVARFPNGSGSTGEILFHTQLAYYVSYMPAMALCFYLLYKYVAAPVSRIMTQSKGNPACCSALCRSCITWLIMFPPSTPTGCTAVPGWRYSLFLRSFHVLLCVCSHLLRRSAKGKSHTTGTGFDGGTAERGKDGI